MAEHEFDDTHECPANGCTARVPYHQLACRPHWYRIPKPFRDAVWRTYQQEGQGSPAHTAAIRAAVGALNGEH